MTLDQRKRIAKIIHGHNYFLMEIGNQYFKQEKEKDKDILAKEIHLGPAHFMKMNEYLAFEVSNLYDWDLEIIIDNSLKNTEIIFGRNDCDFTTTLEIEEHKPSTKEEFNILEKLALMEEDYEKAAQMRDQIKL